MIVETRTSTTVKPTETFLCVSIGNVHSRRVILRFLSESLSPLFLQQGAVCHWQALAAIPARYGHCRPPCRLLLGQCERWAAQRNNPPQAYGYNLRGACSKRNRRGGATEPITGRG